MTTRKASPEPPEPFKTVVSVSVLGFTRETKNTYRFDADDENAPIQSLYVQKAGFPDGPPSVIHVGIGY